MILAVLVVLIWLGVPILLSKLRDDKNEDKLTRVLKIIASLPLYLIILLDAIVCTIIIMIANRFRRKVRILLKNGFTCRKEKEQKREIYYLSKENIIIKISEFDTYEISANGGNTFERVESSTVFSADQREEFRRNFSKFNGCDYRDKELYDPTVKLVEMIQNTRQLFYELSSCFVLKY